MSTTLEQTNGHSPTHSGPHGGGGSGEPRGERSGEPRGDAPTKSFSRRSNQKPDDPVQVRITAGLRDEFDDWYSGQYPGVKQPPSRDPWIEEVFRLGLEQIRLLMPPVPSPAERLEQARKERKS